MMINSTGKENVLLLWLFYAVLVNWSNKWHLPLAESEIIRASAFCSHSICRKKTLTLKSSIFWSANSFYSLQIPSISVFFEVSYLDHLILSSLISFFIRCFWMENCFLMFLFFKSLNQLSFCLVKKKSFSAANLIVTKQMNKQKNN